MSCVVCCVSACQPVLRSATGQSDRQSPDAGPEVRSSSQHLLPQLVYPVTGRLLLLLLCALLRPARLGILRHPISTAWRRRYTVHSNACGCKSPAGTRNGGRQTPVLSLPRRSCSYALQPCTCGAPPKRLPLLPHRSSPCPKVNLETSFHNLGVNKRHAALYRTLLYDPAT